MLVISIKFETPIVSFLNVLVQSNKFILDLNCVLVDGTVKSIVFPSLSVSNNDCSR